MQYWFNRYEIKILLLLKIGLAKNLLSLTPTTVTHLLRSDGIITLFQLETPLLEVGHFVYHMMLIHQETITKIKDQWAWR